MKYLVDANVLVALYKEDDSTHDQAVKLVAKLRRERHEFFALNLVIHESTTVVSYKMDMVNAKRFYHGLTAVVDNIISLDDALEQRARQIFLAQTKKGTSFIDCANLATIEHYKLDGILSFDTFYPPKLRVGQ